MEGGEGPGGWKGEEGSQEENTAGGSWCLYVRAVRAHVGACTLVCACVCGVCWVGEVKDDVKERERGSEGRGSEGARERGGSERASEGGGGARDGATERGDTEILRGRGGG